MQELTMADIEFVSGAKANVRPYDVVPGAKSDWGNRLNDAANMLGTFGGWLGREIYDLTH